jgi:peptidoglycan/LPS O-acetylase OafA/YrhL
MRIHSLQGLRAFSIALVLLAHVSGTHGCFRSRIAECYGSPGVRIFLVLSGYLITSGLMKEKERSGTISLRNFYIRRTYRIFPAAYVFMAIAIATHWESLSAANIATAITYTLNYYPRGNHVLGHLWSLGVEEQFYLIWPLCLLWFFPQRLSIVAVAIGAGPPLRILFWLLWRRAGLEHPFPVFMDALAIGSAVALLEARMGKWRSVFLSRKFAVVPALCLLLPLVELWNGRVYQTVAISLFNLGAALALLHVMTRRYAFLNSAPAVWLGTISYSLYLWQQFFFDRQSSAKWAAFPSNLVLALVVGTASFYLVEQPFLNLRDRRRIRRIPHLISAFNSEARTTQEALLPKGNTSPLESVAEG